VGAFILGLLFGIVSTPCAAPILIVLLAYITAKGSIVYGALLLLFYAFGHCTLVLVAGTSIGAAKSMLDSKGLMKASNYIKKTAGVIIFLLGGYILFVGK
jgi:cytochrome c biogenesis protein CcdA